MFDQAMHHAMINQLSILMNSVQNTVRETMADSMQMGYKGPCYFQLESSAVEGARAGSAAMIGVGTQPLQPNVVQAGAGGYPMPRLLQTQTHWPMGTPIQTAPVFIPSLLLVVSSAHGGLFNTPSGFVPDASLGMPPEYMIPTNTRAPAQTQDTTGAGGSTHHAQSTPPGLLPQQLASQLQLGGLHSQALALQPMVQYQQQIGGYQQGSLAPQPMANFVMKQGGYQL
jgi:hypothetical protein